MTDYPNNISAKLEIIKQARLPRESNTFQWIPYKHDSNYSR